MIDDQTQPDVPLMQVPKLNVRPDDLRLQDSSATRDREKHRRSFRLDVDLLA